MSNTICDTENLLAGILSSSLDGIIAFVAVRDVAGDIVDFEYTLVNNVASKFMRRDGNSLIEKTLIGNFPVSKKVYFPGINIVETGQPLFYEMFHEREGFHNWFDISAVKLDDGLAITFRDVTEKKENETEIINKSHILIPLIYHQK